MAGRMRGEDLNVRRRFSRSSYLNPSSHRFRRLMMHQFKYPTPVQQYRKQLAVRGGGAA